MKFTAPAASLRPLIEAAAELAPGSGKIPQLEATKLEVSDPDHLVVSASNLVEAIRLNLAPVTKVMPGAVFVPSINLLRVIKEAKKEDVTIAWNGKSLHASVSWAGTKVKLPTEPPENQRAFKRFNAKKPFATVPASAFSDLVKRTAFAVQSDFASRTLGGVSVKVKTDALELAATDGRRLAVARKAIPGAGHFTEAVVSPMPPKVIDRLHAEGESVDVQLLGPVLAIRGSVGETARRLLSGHFPDYEAHVPWTMPREIRVKRKDLIALVKKANLLKVAGGINTYFQFEDNILHMEAVASVEGSTEAAMGIDWPHPKVRINLDHTFIDQALKSMSSDEVILGIESGEAQFTIREESTVYEVINVIMPKVGN
jgi:DNA polymerase-3 subunit beta